MEEKEKQSSEHSDIKMPGYVLEGIVQAVTPLIAPFLPHKDTIKVKFENEDEEVKALEALLTTDSCIHCYKDSFGLTPEDQIKLL